MTLGRNDGAHGLRVWVGARSRRLAYKVAFRLFGRIEEWSALGDGQRVRLNGELDADLADQIEDIWETREAPSDIDPREMKPDPKCGADALRRGGRTR